MFENGAFIGPMGSQLHRQTDEQPHLEENKNFRAIIH